MNTTTWIIVLIVVAIVVALISAFIATQVRKNVVEKKIGSAEGKAREIIDEAIKSAEAKKKEALLEAKEENLKAKNELDKEIKERRAEVQRYEKRVLNKEEAIERKSESLEKKENGLKNKEEKLAEAQTKVDELSEKRVQELERISGLTSEQAKEYLLKTVEEEVKIETAKLVKELESQAKEEADKKAKEIVVNAIQKCATDHVSETTISVVSLPNDEMKGRIIGREGRNIRTLESLTGVDLIIDDTEKQIKDKLIQGMYPEDVIKRILEFLKKYDIINDKRYASMYIEYKGKTRSGRQISQDLMIKGISKDIISESFESTDYSDADSLKKIIDKRVKRYNLDDRKDLQKLYQYLMGKGYKYSDIKNELSEYFEHLESQFDDEI